MLREQAVHDRLLAVAIVLLKLVQSLLDLLNAGVADGAGGPGGESLNDASVWKALSNLKRFLDTVNARRAAGQAEAIKERHAFKTEFDEEAKRAMFRHIAA